MLRKQGAILAHFLKAFRHLIEELVPGQLFLKRSETFSRRRIYRDGTLLLDLVRGF